MYAFVELWNARPEWLALSVSDRQTFLSGVAEKMAALDEDVLVLSARLRR